MLGSAPPGTLYPAGTPVTATTASTSLLPLGGGPIFSQTVIWLRAARLRDGDGSLTPQSDWANAAATTVIGVSIQPAGTTETRDAAGIIPTEDWRLFTRRGSVLPAAAGDRIVWDGRTLDVIGVPQTWPGILAGSHHSEIILKVSPPTRLNAAGVGAILHDGQLATSYPQQVYQP
jgi:hypothetical protein